LRPVRAVHLREQVQRAADRDPGGGRVLDEAEARLQARAGPQHNGRGRQSLMSRLHEQALEQIRAQRIALLRPEELDGGRGGSSSSSSSSRSSGRRRRLLGRLRDTGRRAPVPPCLAAAREVARKPR
jgi:hypothetical protein